MKSFTIQLLKLFSFFFLSLSNVSAQTTVVIPASFQSEVGCPGDWMPDCDATRLTQTSPGIWEGTFLIPAGTWEYKVAYDNTWNVNYGAGGEPGGANMMLTLGSATSVHFTYSSITHLVSLTYLAPPVNLAGSFQNEIGCPGDWMPDCVASSLVYDAGANLYYGIFAIPPGDYEFKVTVNNSFTENYGLGGAPNGPNIPLTVPGNKKTLFRYDPVTHFVTTTPVDYSVILAGSFQSELGCPGDWQPDCALTGLTFDPVNNLWKGEITIPAGNYEFKITLDGSWDENFGEGGVPNGPNIPLSLSTTSKVSFVYNPDTHILTYESPSPTTIVLPGSFQSELGCASDWDPACDNTGLTYDEAKNLWTGTFDIPAGYWEFKVAHNNSWIENYGIAGIQNGPNISLNLELPANITFNYDPLTHIVTLLYNTTRLCVTAFYDANANGYQDYMEGIPMENVQFTLVDHGTQSTGSDGKTCFTNLTPGIYTIKETMPMGYWPTTADSQTVNLNEPQTLNFGLVCLGDAGAENIAFWMNKKGEAAFEQLPYWQQDYMLYVLRYFNLRNSDGTDFDPWTYEELSLWLQRSNARNMAYKLSAQMAVLYLNAEVKMLYNRSIQTPGIHFWGMDNNFMDVGSFIWGVNQELYSNSFGGDTIRDYHQNLYEMIEQANNDLTFVQLQPCGSNMITSAQQRKAAPTDNISLPVQIWPNPSTDLFNLRLSKGTGNVQVQIKVMDVQGRQVLAVTGNNQREYQFGNTLLPGLYFVEVIQGSTRSNFKIIKQ